MLRDKEGNRLFRKVIVKIYYPENILKPETVVQRAKARQGFSDENITDLLFRIDEKLTQLYPFWEFHATELTPEHRTARYAITFANYRADQIPAQASSAPMPVIHNPALVDVAATEDHYDARPV